MASHSDVAGAWVDVQLEVSRLRNTIQAGEKATFDVLDGFVSRAKSLVISEDEPVKAPEPASAETA